MEKFKSDVDKYLDWSNILNELVVQIHLDICKKKFIGNYSKIYVSKSLANHYARLNIDHVILIRLEQKMFKIKIYFNPSTFINNNNSNIDLLKFTFQNYQIYETGQVLIYSNIQRKKYFMFHFIIVDDDIIKNSGTQFIDIYKMVVQYEFNNKKLDMYEPIFNELDKLILDAHRMLTDKKFNILNENPFKLVNHQNNYVHKFIISVKIYFNADLLLICKNYSVPTFGQRLYVNKIGVDDTVLFMLQLYDYNNLKLLYNIK